MKLVTVRTDKGAIIRIPESQIKTGDKPTSKSTWKTQKRGTSAKSIVNYYKKIRSISQYLNIEQDNLTIKDPQKVKFEVIGNKNYVDIFTGWRKKPNVDEMSFQAARKITTAEAALTPNEYPELFYRTFTRLKLPNGY